MKKILSLLIVATMVFAAGCAKRADKLPNVDELPSVETPADTEDPVEEPVGTPVESPEETPVENPDEPVETPVTNPSTSEPKPGDKETDKPVIVPPAPVKPLPPTITKPGETITFKDLKSTVKVDFATIKVNSDKVPKGTEMVSQEGKAGSKEIIYRVTYTNGKETARELIRDHVTVAPVDKIITVGTGSTSIPKPTTPPPAPVITYKNVTDKESVPFQIIRVNDSSIEKGKEVTSVDGKSGTREIITKITYSDGTEVSRSVISNQITVQPVNKVILVGTKEAAKPTPTPSPVVTTKNETTTEPVTFQTSRVDDPNLEKGQEVVRQEGKNGTREIVTQITYTDGKETSRKVISNTVTVQPVNKIIAVGTKVIETPVFTYEDSTRTEKISFENENIPDDTMLKGQTKLITAGVLGERKITTRRTFNNKGEVVKEEVISNIITVQPVNQVVHYGTKEVEYPKGITSSAQITALFEAQNTARVNSGLEPLTWSSSLANGASIRAGEISVNGHFSHTRPNGEPFHTVGSGVIGENIAYGGSNGLTAFNMFWGSAGHKANILNAEFKTVGISTHYASDNGATYWAVLFGY